MLKMLQDIVWVLQSSKLGILVCVGLFFGDFSEVLGVCHKILVPLKPEVT